MMHAWHTWHMHTVVVCVVARVHTTAAATHRCQPQGDEGELHADNLDNLATQLLNEWLMAHPAATEFKARALQRTPTCTRVTNPTSPTPHAVQRTAPTKHPPTPKEKEKKHGYTARRCWTPSTRWA